MSSRTIQRVIIALGDLAEAQHDKLKLSKEAYDSRLTITEGASRRRSVTKERQVNPWDERNRLLLDWGPLDNIGTENLRLYGHGQAYGDDLEVSMVGGYTPQKLTTKLIELGLPEGYRGEIYLTGCDTAVGQGHGFLGKFYRLIAKHCPNVSVRGNLGTATSLPSGEQGVWTGAIGKLEYDRLRRELIETKNELLQKNRENQRKNDRLLEKDLALKAHRQKLINQSTLSDQEIVAFRERADRHADRVDRNSARAQELNKLLHDITECIDELDAVAYDSSGSLSVKLPISAIELKKQKEKVDQAVLRATVRNIRRQVKDELRESLTGLYGWSRSHFWELDRQGEFNDDIASRVLSRTRPVPSYFA